MLTFKRFHQLSVMTEGQLVELFSSAEDDDDKFDAASKVLDDTHSSPGAKAAAHKVLDALVAKKHLLAQNYMRRRADRLDGKKHH